MKRFYPDDGLLGNLLWDVSPETMFCSSYCTSIQGSQGCSVSDQLRHACQLMNALATSTVRQWRFFSSLSDEGDPI